MQNWINREPIIKENVALSCSINNWTNYLLSEPFSLTGSQDKFLEAPLCSGRSTFLKHTGEPWLQRHCILKKIHIVQFLRRIYFVDNLSKKMEHFIFFDLRFGAELWHEYEIGDTFGSALMFIIIQSFYMMKSGNTMTSSVGMCRILETKLKPLKLKNMHHSILTNYD